MHISHIDIDFLIDVTCSMCVPFGVLNVVFALSLSHKK